MSARRLLHWISELVVKHPARVLWVAVVVVLLCAIALPGIEVKAGHSGLVDAEDPHEQRFAAFLREFGTPNLLFVLVEGGDASERRAFVDALATDLRGQRHAAGASAQEANHIGTNHVGNVLTRIDLASLAPHGVLQVPVPQLRALVAKLKEHEAQADTFVRSLTLSRLVQMASDRLDALGDQAPVAEQANGELARASNAFVNVIESLTRDVKAKQSDLHIEDLILAQLFARQVTETDTARQSTATASQARENSAPTQCATTKAAFGGSGLDPYGYFCSRDKTMHLALVWPANESDDPNVVVPFVEQVNHVAQRLIEQRKAQCVGHTACAARDTTITLTGLPALITAENKGLSKDLTFTTTLAICGIIALFVFGFRSIPQGIVGLVPLIATLAITLTFVRFVFGGLNMLTTAFIPTVLGLGIDFSVHLLSRFNEARREGKESRQAVRQAIQGAGPGMITGALTTAGAFFALIASDFQGFVHMGIITGVGLMVSLLATLLITSAMLTLPRFRRLQKPPPPPYLGNAPLIARLVARHRKFVLVSALLFTGVMVWRGGAIPWSYNYLDLLPKGSTAVDAMQRLANRTDFSAEVAAFVTDDFGKAQAIVDRLRRLPTVGRVESLTDMAVSDQREKISQLQTIAPILATIGQQRSGAANRTPQTEQKALHDALQRLRDQLEDALFAAKSAGRAEAGFLAAPVAALGELLSALETTPKAQVAARVGAWNRDLSAFVGRVARGVSAIVSSGSLTAERLAESLPQTLRQRLWHNGNFAIYAYPKQSLWSDGFLARFIADLRSVDPTVTGYPVTYWETNLGIERGFKKASVFAALALVVLLLVDFRSVRYASLAIFPLLLGVAWMWGAVSVLGLSYNFANIIGFPLILGIGVASGVHILHRFRQEGERDVIPVVEHTGLAVLLSAATTMVGFGSLALASHRGAASLGFVLLLGVGACLATSTLVLPALLALITSRNPKT